MSRARGLVLALLLGCCLGGCPAPAPSKPQTLPDPVAIDKDDLRASLAAELRDQILGSYERDDPPELDSSMIPPQIGQARIGVGPGDVLLALELARPPSRWPLDVDPRTPTVARSKRLEVHLARDSSAAWAFDEISWRISMCGRTAIIPLRMTSLFARDGDRWVQVFEHVSFGRTPTPLRDGELPPKDIFPGVVSGDLRDDLSEVLSQGLFRGSDRNAKLVSSGRDATLLGPDVAEEWHGTDVIASRLGATITAEDRRIGIVGKSLDEATIAYWVGNFVGDYPARPGIGAGKVKLRGTFVFEQRDDRWVVVQGHLSQPTLDEDLATFVFGTALISPKPLEVTCDDGGRVRPVSPQTPGKVPPPAT